MPTLPTLAEQFKQHYLAAGLTLEDEEIGEDACIDNIESNSLLKAQGECQLFIDAALKAKLLERTEEHFQQAGSDFWLSRNGHGSGFFDRDDIFGEEQAEKLHTLAQTFSPSNIVKGDDGLLYHESY